MLLTLHHDDPESASHFERFGTSSVLAGLKALDSRVRRKGLAGLDPARGALIPIGMEVVDGKVVKNGYGVFSLAWQAERHPEWSGQVDQELDNLRACLREAHEGPVQFLIWAGVGGLAEDKLTYQEAGLLRRGPRYYVLDSTDPSKFTAIFQDIKRRCQLEEPEILRRTVVVSATAANATEPLAMVQKIAARYETAGVDPHLHIYCLTHPGSALDRWAGSGRFHRLPLPLDGHSSIAGRHSAPLTRGSLYPLGLAGIDLKAWIQGAILSADDVSIAWRLASFFHAQSLAGRDKVTLLLPHLWRGAGMWTKHAFEESLGKSEGRGLKLVVDERVRLTNYRSPRDGDQDRVFWTVRCKGDADEHAEKRALLRRAGYPVASLTFATVATLSRFMQFVHYAVFGLAWLRNTNFFTQPNHDACQALAQRLQSEAERVGGIARTKEWQRSAKSPRCSAWRGRLTLRWDRLPPSIQPEGATAPAMYASLLTQLSAHRNVEYGELTFFGDMRYSARGRSLRTVLERGAQSIFRAGLKMPADVNESPAANHAYHEMIAGCGKCFSTLLIAETEEPSEYHCAQFLATQIALAERGRAVVSVTLRNLEDASVRALGEFFGLASTEVRARRSLRN